MVRFNCLQCCFGSKLRKPQSESSELQTKLNVRPSNPSESRSPLVLERPNSEPSDTTKPGPSVPEQPNASPSNTTARSPPGLEMSSSKSSDSTNPSPSVPGQPISPPPATKQRKAFVEALKSHIGTLPPKDLRAFEDADKLTSEILLARVRQLDENHRDRSIGRHDRLKDFLDLLGQGLGTLTTLIGSTSGVASLVQGAVKLVIEFAVRFHSFFTKLTSMMEHLADHLGYLNTWAKTFEDSEAVQDALCKFYGDLIKFCQGVRQVFIDGGGNDRRWTSFRVFLRITWSPFETQFDDIHSRLGDRMLVVARTVTATDQERIRAESLLRSQEEAVEERRRLLAWLAGLSGLNFDADHERISEKWHKGTGEWLLQSPAFMQWLADKESCLLWCYGNPGAGKSVLASRVLDRISEDYALDDCTGVVFAYFNFQVPESQVYERVLATLIRQLCRRRNDSPSQLQGPYRSSNTPTPKELLTQFIKLSQTFNQVILIIDALDECQPRENMLSFITRLSRDTSCRFKVFLTSRRERDIELEVTRGNFPTLQIEAKKVDKDIKVFVQDEVKRRTGPDNRCHIDQKLQDEINEALCSQSNGMFLWASYQLDDIYEQPSTGDIRKILASLPADMHGTYIRILRLIGEQHQSLRDVVKGVLMWVVVAGRPLSPEELAVAVAITPECRRASDICGKYLPKTVIETCRNFVAVDADEVRFVHFTVQEFLTSSLSSIALNTEIDALQLHQHYRIVPKEAHTTLVQQCIRAMLFEDTKDFSPGQYPTRYQVMWKLHRYIFEFFDHHICALELGPSEFADILGDLSGERVTGQAGGVASSANALSLCLALHLLPIFEIRRLFAIPTQDTPGYQETLHHASAVGSATAIAALVESGYTTNMLDSNGAQPLYHTCLHANFPAVGYLLGIEADVNARGGMYGNALQAGVVGGNERIVELLLRGGARINERGGKHCNALQAAAAGGNERIVEILLRGGADIDTQGEGYGSALQAAAAGGNESVVVLLLVRGANVNAWSEEYGNALQAAVYGGSEAIVEILLEHKADVNVWGGRYSNDLHAAKAGGNKRIVELLLEYEADVNARGGGYESVLQTATAGGNERIVGSLLRGGADINARGEGYGNALQAAAAGGNEGIVELLLRHGADMNTNAESGIHRNALRAAVAGGNKRIVEILIEHGENQPVDVALR